MKTKLIKLLGIASLATLVVACGGGAVGTSGGLAEGGIGGTGISQGPITGFGSIFVNGVEYEVAAAEFLRDGVSVSGQADFNIGERVTVEGSVNSDGITGTATRVTFADQVEGPVRSVSPQGTLDVWGQTVVSNGLTLFIGFASLADIKAGDVLEVSGVTLSDHSILASSLKLKPTGGALEVKGRLSSLDTVGRQFSINGLVIDYSSAVFDGLSEQALSNGRVVEVKANSVDGSIAVATKIEAEDSGFAASSQEDISVEGVVTRFASLADFDVNGAPVTTDSNTRFEDGSAAGLGLDSQVKIEGALDDQGVLILTEVRLQDQADDNELKGLIQVLDPAARSLVVLGQTLFYTTSTISVSDEDNDDREDQLNFGDLRVGDYIEVHGYVDANQRFIISRLDRKDSPESGSSEGESGSGGAAESEISGPVTELDEVSMTLTIGGISIVVSDSTEIQAEDEGPSTWGDVAAVLSQPGAEAEAKGVLGEDGRLYANTLETSD